MLNISKYCISHYHTTYGHYTREILGIQYMSSINTILHKSSNNHINLYFSSPVLSLSISKIPHYLYNTLLCELHVINLNGVQQPTWDYNSDDSAPLNVGFCVASFHHTNAHFISRNYHWLFRRAIKYKGIIVINIFLLLTKPIIFDYISFEMTYIIIILILIFWDIITDIHRLSSHWRNY